jgi:hypothetical protein
MTKVIIDNEVTYTVEISNSAADVQIISGGAGTSLIEETAGSITTLRTVSSGDNLNIAVADSDIAVTLADDITVNTVTGDLFGAVDFNAKNTEGSTITKGTPVYISGHSGSHPEISIAVNDDSNKMPAFGIAAEDITNHQRGDIATFGEVTGFDTSAFAVGDELYISNSGTLTNIRPTATNQRVQKVAKVIRSHQNNGILFIMGAGRTNDVPNVFDYNMFPSVDGFVQFGSESFRWGAVHAVNVEATTVSGDLTGDVTGNLTGNLSSNTYITGDFIPSADLTYNLGSPTNAWHSAYIGPGSLYIDGHKVLGSDETGQIDITTDDDQNLNIFAGGSGTDGTITMGSAGGATNIQDAAVNLGPTTNDGTINVRGTLEAADIHNGPLELSGTLIEQTSPNQNLEIRTNGTGYLHANVADLYVGPLSGAVKIDENSISATAGTLTVTGNLTGDVTGDLTSSGTSTFSGTVDLNGATVNNAAFDLTGNVTGDLTGHLLRSTTDTRSLEPVQNNTYTCGTDARGWSAVYVGSNTKLEEGKLSTTASNQPITLEAEGSGYISLYGDSVNFGETGGTGYLSISGSTGALTANGTYDKLILDDAVQINGSITSSDDEVTVDDDLKVIGSVSSKNTTIGDATVSSGQYDTHGFKIEAGDTAWASVILDEYVGDVDKPAPAFTNPSIVGQVTGGTVGNEAAVPSGKRLMVIAGHGTYDNNGSIEFPPSSPFRMLAETTENHTASARGTKFQIETTPDGSTNKNTVLFQGDTVNINAGGDGVIRSGNNLKLGSPLDTNNNNIFNSGGDVVVGDNLKVNNELTVDGQTNLNGNVNLGNANTDVITASGKLKASNGFGNTVLDTATANYLSGVLGIVQTGDQGYISDGNNGSPCMAFFDGSNWKKFHAPNDNISSS